MTIICGTDKHVKYSIVRCDVVSQLNFFNISPYIFTPIN